MAQQKESTLVAMVLTLLVITVISALSLGYINEITLAPKEQARQAKKKAAISMVVPEYDNNPLSDMYKLPIAGTGDSLEVYPAKKGSELVGYAVATSSAKGFSGTVKLMVGMYPDGKIYDISVLEQKETPGLGTKMTEPKFKDQFKEQDPAQFSLSVQKDGGDVVAITASTISSRAFCEAAKKAYDIIKQQN